MFSNSCYNSDTPSAVYAQATLCEHKTEIPAI